MKRLMMAIAMSAIAGASYGNNLCSNNPYSKAEAAQGKVAFDSHCAYCHQYNMTGRTAGNSANESPDIKILSDSDLKFLDGNGGNSPPLVGEKFRKRQMGQTFTDFSTTVSGAANSFPTKDFQQPKSYFLIMAYVLYRNCGKM